MTRRRRGSARRTRKCRVSPFRAMTSQVQWHSRLNGSRVKSDNWKMKSSNCGCHAREFRRGRLPDGHGAQRSTRQGLSRMASSLVSLQFSLFKLHCHWKGMPLPSAERRDRKHGPGPPQTYSAAAARRSADLTFVGLRGFGPRVPVSGCRVPLPAPLRRLRRNRRIPSRRCRPSALLPPAGL
jgi:hypothetical protein